VLTPLDTKVILVERLLVEAGGRPDAPEDSFDIDVKPSIAKNRDGWAFRISLALKMKARIAAQARFRKVEITTVGYFELPADTPEETVHQLVPLNCFAILHGFARGIVAQVTGVNPGGPFLLPTINFVELMKREAAKEEGKTDERCQPSVGSAQPAVRRRSGKPS